MKASKSRYKTTHWPAYNRSLQMRSDLTIWFSPELACYGNERIGKIGRPTRYLIMRYKLTAIKHLGRAIWKRWSDYHQRNLIETAMHRSTKRLFIAMPPKIQHVSKYEYRP